VKLLQTFSHGDDRHHHVKLITESYHLLQLTRQQFRDSSRWRMQ